MIEHALRQASGTLSVETRGKGLVDITDEVGRWLDREAMTEGLLTLFCRHTSASLIVQENAAPAVRRDIAAYFERIVPEDAGYEHDDEGPDDMPAHIRSALTASSLQIPVAKGRLRLGTWQAIYLFEHRRRPHRREIALHLIGT
jgi:secondary thiamine-phosphate synthase enzyme